MGLRCEIEPDDTSMVKTSIESLQEGCMCMCMPCMLSTDWSKHLVAHIK